MKSKNEDRDVIVQVNAKCQHCGSGREIGHASPPVDIGEKKIQYIPAFTCPSCGKGNHPTYYEDLAEATKDLAIKQSMKYAIRTTILTSPISFLLGIFFTFLLNLGALC